MTLKLRRMPEAAKMAEIDRQRTSIRDEIGDEAYDRYLAALDHPNIAIELQPNGQSNWSGLIEALVRSQADTNRLAAFSEMRIDGGTVGDVFVALADVVAGTISGKNHKHGGVQPGNSQTTGPV